MMDVTALRDLRRIVAGRDYPPPGPAPWSGPGPRWRLLALQAGLLALIGLATTSVVDLQEHRQLPEPVAGLIGYGTTLPVALAFHRPLLAWRLSYFGLFLGAVDAPADQDWPWHPVQILAYVVVLLAVAVRADAGVVAGIGVLTLVPLFLLMRTTTAYGATVLFAGILILGDQIRRRRQSQRALVAQAERSELEQARRAVLEERARIARELHDVVAHHMSMIAVQAETAPYRLATLPDPARAEFTAIAGAARSALTDMRRLLGVLRSETRDAPRTPQPGLADVPELVAAARRAGLAVELDTRGDRPGVGRSGPLGLAAYRIVQEALANAGRHAPGAVVRVELRLDGRDLHIQVRNGPPATPPQPGAGPGHGLAGMRERALLLGGDFTAGTTPDGGFAVAARLPDTGEDET